MTYGHYGNFTVLKEEFNRISYITVTIIYNFILHNSDQEI